MRLLRTASTRRLLVLLAAVAAAIAAGAAGAVSALGGSGSPPPPKPLAQALHDAAAAAKPTGLSARVTFTNRLFPSISGLGRAAQPLVADGSGRLWLLGDGRGRIELQSDAGDAQIVWNARQATVYDASSNTVYRIALPAQTQQTAPQPKSPPTVAQITTFLQKLAQAATVSGADPLVLAGTQPAYSVRVTPKDASGLFAGGSVAWDASTGVPLQVGLYARGDRSPVLALKVTQISYGAVPDSDVVVAPPADAKVVDLSLPSGSGAGAKQAPVTGLGAVQAKLPFALVAPDALGARQRSEVRLVGTDSALLLYGQGLGSVAVLESQPKQGSGQPPGILAALPKVPVGSASAAELSTPLGTVLRFEHGGLSFVVGASLPAAEVEGAAANLAS